MKHYIYPILLTIAILIALPFIFIVTVGVTLFFRQVIKEEQQYWHPKLQMWWDCGLDNWDKRGYKLRSRIC